MRIESTLSSSPSLDRLASALLSVAVGCIVLAVPDAAGAASQQIELALTDILKERQTLVVRQVGDLASGAKQTFTFDLPGVEALDLRVPLEDAPFNGTRLDAKINGKRLLPYFAFGGDTRYDNVRGRPGMRPPLATIEGRWLIPPSLLRKGRNELTLWTSGVRPDETLHRLGPKPEIRITSLSIRAVDGGDLPTYANSVYFDFNVWPQGYDWGDNADTRHRYDLALLGVINGKGMPPVIPALGAPESSLWAVKRACEQEALGWGVGHQEFYTIWEFCAKPQLWGNCADVDKNPDTQSQFHDQTVFEHLARTDPAARGADVILYDLDKFAKALEPAIRFLAPYTDFYNFKCEQHGPWGQGFGDNGERWAQFAFRGDLWASNFYQATKAAHDLVMKYNPDRGRVQEMNHWLPPIRHVLFDTALRRGEPVCDMIDVLTNHFATLFTYDHDRNGSMIPGETVELQYPGGIFDRERGSWPEHLVELGYRAVETTETYPEVAIDFNRYRLGRTQEDMILGDPRANRWGSGQPFDYRAGLRGDELMYNSENGFWSSGYSAPAAYQFIHGFFSYSLLPTGSSEPRDLKITARKSLTETRDVTVNLYGRWIEGAGHTKRLRTVDPLYGDLFGWTGEEHCNSGDYITMVGIKDRHHRLPPHDAYGLVRRICYSFVTAGPVMPAYLNPGSSDELFVKCMLQVFNLEHYIGLYAANFDDRPHPLDVTLPIPFAGEKEALVFDNRAGDWRDARRLRILAGRPFRYRQSIPALSAWLVLIPAELSEIAHALDLPAPPLPLSPAPDAAVTQDQPTFVWRSADARGVRYVVEVAREALFRSQDRVELSQPVAALAYTMAAAPQEQSRYFWRVRAADVQGRSGLWTAPSPFVYRWPEYSSIYSPKESPTGPGAPAPPAPPEWQRLAEQHGLRTAENLAWQGEIFATGGHMNSPSRAVDSQAFSYWTNGEDETNSQFALPAEWCLIWPEPVRIRSVKILWLEDHIPRQFVLQASHDAANWTELFKSEQGGELFTHMELPRSVKARYFRLYITAPGESGRQVGVREIVIQ